MWVFVLFCGNSAFVWYYLFNYLFVLSKIMLKLNIVNRCKAKMPEPNIN